MDCRFALTFAARALRHSFIAAASSVPYSAGPALEVDVSRLEDKRLGAHLAATAAAAGRGHV